MGANSDLFLHIQEQEAAANDWADTMPVMPLPGGFKSLSKTDKAKELLEFLAECLHSMHITKRMIDDVDNGIYSATIYHPIEYRESLVAQYNNLVIMHSQTLDLYIKLITSLTDINQFHNPQNKAA